MGVDGALGLVLAAVGDELIPVAAARVHWTQQMLAPVGDPANTRQQA